MPAKRSVVDAALQELYEQVPTVACKGLCHYSCTAIDASARERQRIRAAGVRLPTFEQMKQGHQTVDGYRCPALSADNRCTVYEVRPMVCRTWGVSQTMRCPHGCEVDGEILSVLQALALVLQSMMVGGSLRATPAEYETMLQMLDDPEQQERYTQVVASYQRSLGAKRASGVSGVFGRTSSS